MEGLVSPSHVRVAAPQSHASQRHVGSLGEEPSPTTLRQRPPVCPCCPTAPP